MNLVTIRLLKIYLNLKIINFLEKEKVLNVINSHRNYRKFYVFKNYPSNLKIKIEKAKLLAITKKNGLNFYIGSNGNFQLIKSNK